MEIAAREPDSVEPLKRGDAILRANRRRGRNHVLELTLVQHLRGGARCVIQLFQSLAVVAGGPLTTDASHIDASQNDP